MAAGAKVQSDLNPGDEPMAFRFANLSGRSALVDTDDNLFDLSGLTDGRLPADPMAALADPGALHDASSLLAGATPDDTLAAARERYLQLMDNPGHIEQVLKRGAERARAFSTPLLAQVRDAVGIAPMQ
jgi:hypothetical protein